MQHLVVNQVTGPGGAGKNRATLEPNVATCLVMSCSPRSSLNTQACQTRFKSDLVHADTQAGIRRVRCIFARRTLRPMSYISYTLGRFAWLSDPSMMSHVGDSGTLRTHRCAKGAGRRARVPSGAPRRAYPSSQGTPNALNQGSQARGTRGQPAPVRGTRRRGPVPEAGGPRGRGAPAPGLR